MKLLIGLLVLFAGVEFGHADSLEQCFINNVTVFAATTVSTIASTADSTRRCLILQTTAASGGSTVYVKVDNAHTGTEGVWLLGGEKIVFPVSPTNALYMKSSAGSVNVNIMSGKRVDY